MIETSRLSIRPLSCKELKRYAAWPAETPIELDPQEPIYSIDEETLEIIEKDILPRLTGVEEIQLFRTMWILVDRMLDTVVGEFCFHGDPDKSGEVEIGYRIDKMHQRKGYMTEAVDGIIRWIEKKQEITSILAETSQTNIASQAVLRKNNFKIHHESGDLILFRTDISDKSPASSGSIKRAAQP